MLYNFFKLVCFLLVLTISNGHLATKRLYEDLLSDYNRLIRPVENNNHTVYVNLSLKLTQLLDINMKAQVWVEQSWFDFQLQWNPKDYDNVEMIYIPAEDIWTADIVLFNNADGIYEVASMTKALVYHTGEVYWKPPALFKSTCEIDVKYFPFDIQTCSMKFASWTYNQAEVDLRTVDKSYSVKVNKTTEPETARLIQESLKLNQTFRNNAQNEKNKIFNHSVEDLLNKTSQSIVFNKQVQPEFYSLSKQYSGLETVEIGIDMSEFYSSVEWDVLSVPAYYKKEFFSGLQNPYPEITFKIKLRRKTLFYTVNLIIPIVGNTFLTLLVFYLPSDSGEKTTLSISNLVSLTVFFLLLAEIIPPTSMAVPLLGKYLLFTMILITLSICCTVGILNIHFRSLSTHIMQPWVRSFFIETLPKYLLMHRPTIKDLQKELRALSKPNKLVNLSCTDLDKNENTLRFLPAQSSYYGYKGIQSTSTSFDEEVQLNESAFVYNLDSNLDQLPYDTDLGMPSLIFPQIQPKNFNNNNYMINQNIIKNQQSNPSQNPAQQKDPDLIGFRKDAYGKDVEQAIQSILIIAEHLKREDEEKNVIEDWKFVAMTLDRLFLILFTFVCVIGSCLILLQSPSLYDLSPAIESPNLRNLISSSGS